MAHFYRRSLLVGLGAIAAVFGKTVRVLAQQPEGGQCGVVKKFPSMVTLVFYATAKEGKAQEFHDLAVRVAEVTQAEHKGCLTYVVYQRQDNPHEFVFYEQWHDHAALDAHLAHLQAVFGPPAPGRRVPAAIVNLCEKSRGVYYQVVA